MGNNSARVVGIQPTAPPATVEEAKQQLADASYGRPVD